jgi:hypothetical protein
MSEALQSYNRIDEEFHVIISKGASLRERTKDLLRTHGPVCSSKTTDKQTLHSSFWYKWAITLSWTVHFHNKEYSE